MIQIARDEKLTRVKADILRENIEMQRVCEKVGFALTPDLEEGVVRAAIEIK